MAHYGYASYEDHAGLPGAAPTTESESNGGVSGWFGSTLRGIGRGARERAQRLVDDATLTVNLPDLLQLPTTVTLGSGNAEAPPPEVVTATGNGNGTATGFIGTDNKTLLLVGAAVALFVFMRK